MSGLKDKLYSYFVGHHGAFIYNNGWLRIPVCPFCGREDKLGVHLGKGRIHCFRCDYNSHDLVQAVADIENLSDSKAAIMFLRNIEGKEYVEPKYDKVEEREVILPEGFKTLRVGDTTIAQMARNYVTNRGFDYKQLSRLGVGYVADSNSKYFGYLIVPFHKGREVIYFQTRRFFGTGPKFNNPKYEDFGIGKNQVIYNASALDRFTEVNALESFTNAWTLGQNSISLNGKTLSAKQLSIILKGKKAELINILLDHDAWKYALALASALIGFKKLRVVWFEDDRDVNDLGSKATMKLIDNTPIITSFSDLTKLKNENHKI